MSCSHGTVIATTQDRLITLALRIIVVAIDVPKMNPDESKQPVSNLMLRTTFGFNELDGLAHALD
jgi:hypothetical protein